MHAVLDSGYFVLGPRVDAFERQFAALCGVAHCIGVGNGSDALEISLRALDIGQGDKVVTVANAGMYATFAIRNVGAVPVFCDVDPSSMTMDPQALEELLDPGCRAIVVTHLYGRLAQIDAILALAAARSLPVIEDCAQAHGAGRAGSWAGCRGVLGCFSFYPTKNLGALGDGGAITTSDPQLADKVRRLRQYGWARKYEVTLDHGRNSRLDELQAALLSVKLPYLERWNERRREIARAYNSGIRHPLVALPYADGADYVAHLFVVRCAQRNSLRAHLLEQGVSCDVHYPIPDHRQPVLREQYAGVRLPVTEDLADKVLSLPLFPEMTEAEIDLVVDSCNRWTA